MFARHPADRVEIKMAIAKILVPTDFSENALAAFKTAVDLARQLGARVFLLHVQEESALRIAVQEGILIDGATDDEVESSVNQLILSRFSGMEAGLVSVDVTITRALLRGDPKALVSAHAEELGADLIVMGTTGLSAIKLLGAALMGSVAESVLRKSPCPVMFVRPDQGPRSS